MGDLGNIERLLGNIDERTETIQKDVRRLTKKVDIVCIETVKNTQDIKGIRRVGKWVFGGGGVVALAITYLKSKF